MRTEHTKEQIPREKSTPQNTNPSSNNEGPAELIKWAKSSPHINKGIWGKATVEALKRHTTRDTRNKR